MIYKIIDGVSIPLTELEMIEHQNSTAPFEVEADRVRNRRNALLLESDWTQVIDSPADKAAWATYRQALRGVTGDAGFPWTVEWPQKPI